MTPPLSPLETLVVIAMLALGIMATRFTPFLLFSRKERIPGSVLYLGSVLPHAAMAMLLVYCLKDVSLLSPPNGLPEFLGVAFTAGMHLWRNNVLLSIAGGTLFYMGLVQVVFA